MTKQKREIQKQETTSSTVSYSMNLTRESKSHLGSNETTENIIQERGQHTSNEQQTKSSHLTQRR